MQFVPKPGYLLCEAEPDEDRTASGIRFPDERKRKRTSCKCILHNPTPWWLLRDDRLDGARVLVEKWNWKLVTLGEATYYLIPEGAVFGVIEETE